MNFFPESILVLVFSIFLLHCKSPEKNIHSSKNHYDIPSGDIKNQAIKENSGSFILPDSIPKIIIDKNFLVDSGSEKFNIDTALVTIDGILEIRIRYSGGCREHRFSLFSNKIYMKSMPPQVKLFLTHKSDNDHCRNLISRTLFFNISELKYEGQKKLLLIINDNPNKIEYLY